MPGMLDLATTRVNGPGQHAPPIRHTRIVGVGTLCVMDIPPGVSEMDDERVEAAGSLASKTRATASASSASAPSPRRSQSGRHQRAGPDGGGCLEDRGWGIRAGCASRPCSAFWQCQSSSTTNTSQVCAISQLRTQPSPRAAEPARGPTVNANSHATGVQGCLAVNSRRTSPSRRPTAMTDANGRGPHPGASSGFGEATAKALAADRLRHRRRAPRSRQGMADVEEIKANIAGHGREALFVNMKRRRRRQPIEFRRHCGRASTPRRRRLADRRTFVS